MDKRALSGLLWEESWCVGGAAAAEVSVRLKSEFHIPLFFSSLFFHCSDAACMRHTRSCIATATVRENLTSHPLEGKCGVMGVEDS